MTKATYGYAIINVIDWWGGVKWIKKIDLKAKTYEITENPELAEAYISRSLANAYISSLPSDWSVAYQANEFLTSRTPDAAVRN